MVLDIHVGRDARHARQDAWVKTEDLLNRGVEVGKLLNLRERRDSVLVGNGCGELIFHFLELLRMSEKLEHCSAECVCYILKYQRH